MLLGHIEELCWGCVESSDYEGARANESSEPESLFRNDSGFLCIGSAMHTSHACAAWFGERARAAAYDGHLKTNGEMSEGREAFNACAI